MECHYKVLGVELNADDDAIKKGYRKAALKYHPDKNLDCLEEATERFRLIQAAYDVLSDPQERAWYDRHREEILHRKKYENYKDNSFDLWDYFTPSAYKGFGDDEHGFFAVYRDVFQKIVAEDEPFRSDDSDNEHMPSFGDSHSDYNDVVHSFYSCWQAYCTHLSFVWESQYDVKEAPNRRVARIIEKENKKERDKHKKKRNELVRQLVSFVRKRDPRVKAHRAELEKIAAEQALKAEERRESAIREKIKEAAKYDEENKEEIMKHHERVAELENMMRNEFGFSTSEDEDSQQEDNSEEEDYKDDLFCVACNKLFKSKMGFRNHGKSKKHKENMNRLREDMKEEEENDGERDNEECEEMSSSNDVPEMLDDFSQNVKLSKKQKKQKRQQQKLLSNSMSAKPMEVEPVEKGEILDNMDNQCTNKMDEEFKNDPISEEKSTEDVKDESSCVDTLVESNIIADTNHENENETSKSESVRTSKKSKQKKQKQQSLPKSDSSNTESLGCGKCSQVFRSRNKLFQHLKQTGHSLTLESGTSKRKDKRTRK